MGRDLLKGVSVLVTANVFWVHSVFLTAWLTIGRMPVPYNPPPHFVCPLMANWISNTFAHIFLVVSLFAIPLGGVWILVDNRQRRWSELPWAITMVLSSALCLIDPVNAMSWYLD